MNTLNNTPKKSPKIRLIRSMLGGSFFIVLIIMLDMERGLAESRSDSLTTFDLVRSERQLLEGDQQNHFCHSPSFFEPKVLPQLHPIFLVAEQRRDMFLFFC